jgi:hypothetical protein
MKQWMVIFIIPLFLISMPVFVWADGEHQHEPLASEKVQEHQHEGMDFTSILTGSVTLIAVLFTFSLGFLGRRGIMKFNIRLHSLGAYTAVSLSIIHVIVNVLTH